MSLSAVISDVRAGTTPFTGNAPEDDGRPSDDEPTTLNTARMLPPYMHNQEAGTRSFLGLVGTVLSIYWLLSKVI